MVDEAETASAVVMGARAAVVVRAEAPATARQG